MSWDGETRAVAPKKAAPNPKKDLLALMQNADLWHSPEKAAYATIEIAGRVENIEVQSAGFKHWLRSLYFKTHNFSAPRSAVDDVQDQIEAMALFDHREHPVFRRVGFSGGALYIDLCNDAGQVVEVTSNNWTVTDRPAVRFIRSRHARALPVPEIDDSPNALGRLRQYINVATEDDFRLAVAWLIGAYAPEGPYPIAVITGEQGSAKSTVSRILRDLTDPSASLLRSQPRDERDMAIGAVNNRVLAFDNVSSVPQWQSDAFCRLATGGGFATRELHSDAEEIVLEAVRPIILNGITDLVRRPDLGERSIMITTRRLAESERLSERAFRAEYEKDRPYIFGALLDGLVSAMRKRDSVHLERLPRMADFAIWATAAEAGLGFEDRAIVRAFTANRDAAVRGEIENDDVATAVIRMIERRDDGIWEGSASSLLIELNQITGEAVQRLKGWPKTAAGLGQKMARLQPSLRAIGIDCEKGRAGKDGGRLWTIRQT